MRREKFRAAGELNVGSDPRFHWRSQKNRTASKATPKCVSAQVAR